MQYKQQLADRRDRVSGFNNPRDYITVHETANKSRGADAQAHANLQSRGGTQASWHWTVDDSEAIQSYSHKAQCWHAGDGRGNGNMKSIGIEICVNADGDYGQAIANAAKLVAKIMREEGISISRVVQHNHWSGKNCPTGLRQGTNWAKFLRMVEAEYAGTSKPKPKPTPSKPAAKPQQAKISVDGYWGPATTTRAQQIAGTPADGKVSAQPRAQKQPGLGEGWHWVAGPTAVALGGSQLIRELQIDLKAKGLYKGKIDGLAGPQFWTAFQKAMGTPVDGRISAPSLAVKQFQRNLNAGKLW